MSKVYITNTDANSDYLLTCIEQLKKRVEALEKDRLNYFNNRPEPEKPKPVEEVKESECRHDKLKFNYMEMTYYCEKCHTGIDLIDRQLAIEKVKEITGSKIDGRYYYWCDDVIKALEEL